MDFGLEGKRALVLGSSQGLGFGIAKELNNEGVVVGLCGRDQAKLENSKSQLINSSQAHCFTVDLSSEASVAKLIEDAKETLGTIDILVNNCGGPPPGPIAGVETETWQAQFNTMAATIFNISSQLLPAMRENKWGRIINIASSGVIQPIPNLGISNAIRASIIGWAKTLATEVAADGVTVNTVLPGRIHTLRVDQLDEAAAKRQDISVEQAAANARATIPMQRYGEVEEFAAAATFLASERASYITGSVMRIDGGLIKSL